jgi:gliding motility-associated-like protein
MPSRLILIFLFLFSGLSAIHATHIVGGELTYKCLGNSEYELTLTVYRDCYTGQPPFDTMASIGIFDKNWILRQHILVDFNELINDTLPILLSDPCLVAPPDVCVHRTIYTKVITLPFLTGGYNLVYQRCCRNNLIRNIEEPLATGASFTVEISEKALLECNDGAVFNYWPPVAICVHQPIDFDHSATDPDGDSLVYRLCVPLSGATAAMSQPQPPNAGPYAPVVWSAPYDLSNVLGGDPLKINPQTGFLTGVPDVIGNFVVGVCVDEYRNDEIISTTRRDFQYNVADCGRPLAAFFAPVSLCDTLTYQFQNQSIAALFFRWYFDYPNDLMQTSVGYSPIHTFPDTGWYNIALVANPNQLCSDTFMQRIHVTKTFVAADLDLQYPGCDDSGLIVHAQDKSEDQMFGINAWTWTLIGPDGEIQAVSPLQNPDFKVKKPGNYTLKLKVTSGNGCQSETELSFDAPYPPITSLKDSLTICKGDTIPLFPAADPAFTYMWSPDQFLSDPETPNPLAFPETTQSYVVTVSGNGPCVLEKTVKVKVVNNTGLVVTAEPTVVYPGESSQLEAVFPGSVEFIWEPAATLSDPNIYNPIATPLDTTLYTVRVPLSSGCLINGSVLIYVLHPFCDEPFVFFPTGFSPNQDGENDVLKLESKYATEVYWVIYSRWGEKLFEAHSLNDFWDGTFKGKEMPAETYGYYLKVRCIDGNERIKKGNVTLLR